MLGRTGAPRDCVAFLDHAAVIRLAETHLERLAAIDSGRAARIVDKMPDNYMYIGLLVDHVSPGDVHPLPARPARHRRLVLDDRFPQYSLVERSEQHRVAVPAVSPRDEPLEAGLARADSRGELRRHRHRPGSRPPAG